MFYNNYDDVHGEDKWGLVGQVGDPFREGRVLAIPCTKCRKKKLIIAERNWMATNNDHSQRYQIVVACLNCGAVDEFIANNGRENKNSKLKFAKVIPEKADLMKENKE